VVIYPPVETRRFGPAARPDDFYLVLSRLIPYKRVDLAVQAFNQLGRPLVVAGDGRDRARLESMAQPNVTFLGRVSDADAADLMARCRAFVFPGLEDFGIAPVQAMAAGRPVVAYAGGGALDTVVEGVTGAFFREPTADCLAAAVRAFEAERVDPDTVRRHAERFDMAEFERQMAGFLEAKTGWRRSTADSRQPIAAGRFGE
jgi:glycosyltransferase involved in cell wall biosynthesis